jgi:hypothetical protein
MAPVTTKTRTFNLGHEVTIECASMIAEELRSRGVRASASIDHHMVRNVSLVVVSDLTICTDGIIEEIQSSICTIIERLDSLTV